MGGGREPRQEQRWEQTGVERLVAPVAVLGHVARIEVHGHQPAVGLGHAVLQAGGDPELLGLHREGEAREQLAPDLDIVELA